MSRKLLLVDDDHGPMDYFVEALKEHGFEVTQIDSTMEALVHLDSVQHPPDAIVVDLMMPPMPLTMRETRGGMATGVILHKRFREKYPNVPIIVLTNQTDISVLSELPSDTIKYDKFDIDTNDFAVQLEELVSSAPS